MQVLQDFISLIGQIDRDVFLFLNSFHAKVLDDFFIMLSNRWVWIPLYAFLLYAVWKRFGLKSIYIVVAVVLLITLADQISVHFFKNYVQRLRPCHDDRILPFMHLVAGCGGKFGFVSSHASNVFALAVFFSKLFEDDSKWWTYGLLFWASLVSYSRIYLGVHYPMDLIGGAVIGSSLAFLVYRGLILVPAFKIKEK